MNKTIILAAIVMVGITVVTIAVTQSLIPALSPSSVMGNNNISNSSSNNNNNITIPLGKNNKEEVIDSLVIINCC